MNARPLRSEALREALGYPKFSSQPKILLFQASYYVVGDLQDALDELGWPYESMPVASHGQGTKNFIADLLVKLVTFRPDYILTVNHFGFDQSGTLADLLATYGVPVASWFVDHPLPILGDASTSGNEELQVFTFERTSIGWLASRGFRDAAYLPTAASSWQFRSRLELSEAAPEIECSFVGNSWWDKARIDPPRRAQKAAQAWLDRANVREWLLRDESRLATELAGLGDGQISGTTVVRTAVAEASLRKRQRFAQTFAELGARFYGDVHWRKVAPQVNLHPPVCYRTRQSSIFATTAVNLNVTADHMPTAVNTRVWTVPAAGGALVTDAQEDVFSFFRPDEDIVTYADWQEGIDKVKFLLGHPDARNRIQRNASLRVREHTYAQRLRQLHQTMHRRFGQTSRLGQ